VSLAVHASRFTVWGSEFRGKAGRNNRPRARLPRVSAQVTIWFLVNNDQCKASDRFRGRRRYALARPREV
jgi:hypothetical protein